MMAQQGLDQTGQENSEVVISKIGQMFTELYSSFGGATSPSVTAVTASDAITGGSLVTTGATSTATLTATGLVTEQSLKLDTGTKTAAATAGAATLNKSSGVITSEALTTAAGADYTLTLTNSTIAAADIVMASVQLGSATTGVPTIASVTPGSGSVVIVVQNIHASAAVNGTLKIAFAVFKA
jgi:hypothetical protein